jgi:hypothetical protein
MRKRSPLIRGLVLCAALVLGACVPSRAAGKGPPGAEEARAAYRAVVKKARAPRKDRKPLEMPWLEKIGNIIKAIVEWTARHKLAVIAVSASVAAAGTAYSIIRRGGPKGIRLRIRAAAPVRTRARKPLEDPGADELIALAEESASAGDFSRATVILHRAALAFLSEKGVLRRGRSYGNAEIRSILENKGFGAADFAVGARSAESAAFGRRVLARSDWDRALEASRGLMGALA